MADNEKSFIAGYSQFLDASGEHITYAALSTFRNSAGELSQKEREFFEHHLNGCASCSARLLEIAEIEGEPAIEKPKNILSFSPNLFRYAIAAILIIAIGITVAVVLQNPQQEQITSQQIPSDQNIAEVSLDPERFVPNRVLENFVERTVRSSSGITLLAPVTGDTIAFPFTFKWKGNEDGKSVVIAVVDNKNNDMWNDSSSSLELASGKKLDPGLYYLKLSMDEKLVQVGKFVVVK